MGQETTPHAEPQKAPERKHSMGARLLVATAFSTIGAKIGTIGSVMDANDIFKGESLSLGQKLKSPFNGKFNAALGKRIEELMNKEGRGLWNALAKLSKWTIITTGIGMVAGGVIGWVQGGRIENWKDIFKHPWQSTKIIFGAEPPSTANAAAPITVQVEAAPPAKQWTNTIQPRAAAAATHADAVRAEKSSGSPAIGA